MWPAEGHETIGHFDVKCTEVQPFDGYDIIKLDATRPASVSGNLRPHVHEEVYVIAVHVILWHSDYQQFPSLHECSP